MNKKLIITSPRWYALLLWSFFILYGGYLWSIGWENSYYRALPPEGCVVIGIMGLVLELQTVAASEKHLMVWWFLIPVRIIPWKNITSITIVQKANDARDDSLRALITLAPCVYRADMTLTAAEFARQHLIKGIFFRIPRKNPEGTLQKLKAFCPHLEIPYIKQ